MAIVAIELAMITLWKYIGITPDAVIGHSLGEFAALCTAGVMSVSTCPYLEGRRAMLVAENCAAGTHAMQVVHEGQEYVKKYLVSMPQVGDSDGKDSTAHYTSQTCGIACINRAKSTVVSGPSKKVDVSQQQLTESGVRTSVLKVSFAFHSSRMDAILNDYETEAERLSFMAPRVPIASAELGKLVASQGIIDATQANTKACKILSSRECP
ncbi:acyl transferase/acyl hydrolase/lysophospholipase [Xylaria grammica]|nr:acyl transferase/acyl hydrolase/lysophospholipase [Xylaria grammica]